MVNITCNHISEFRQRLGMSQRDLASLIGVSKNTICNIERGFSYPSLTHAIDLCIILKCSLFDLFSFSIFSSAINDHFVDTFFDKLILKK